MKLKWIMTWDGGRSKCRLLRLIWERGSVGDGGYSAMVSLSLWPKLLEFDKSDWPAGWRFTILGISIHHMRSYGGWFC